MLLQSLLLLWCFILMLLELDIFGTSERQDRWGVAPVAVGTILIIATLGTLGYVFYTAYAETDWDVIAPLQKYGTARTAFGNKFNKGDVVLREASGKLKVMNPDEFEELFELDPGRSSSTDFRPYRATGKLWVHELSETEVAAFFPAGIFHQRGALVTVKAGDVLVMPFPGGGAVYRLDKQTFEQGYANAVSGDDARRGSIIGGYIPSQAETLAHWESKLKASGAVYRKTAIVHARLAKEDGIIETVVTHQPYAKGDYIVIGSRGTRYSMLAVDFSARYDHSKSQPASDPELAREGFSLYLRTGMIWAHEITVEEVQRFFPIGKFEGKWGGDVSVEGSDYLAIPHPACGEVYVIKHDLFHNSYARHAMPDHIPSEVETLAQWNAVLRREARVCRKKDAVLAKFAEQDGALDEMMQQQEEIIDINIKIGIPTRTPEDEAGVIMVPLRSGEGASPVQDANARSDEDTSISLWGKAPCGLWGTGSTIVASSGADADGTE